MNSRAQVSKRFITAKRREFQSAERLNILKRKYREQQARIALYQSKKRSQQNLHKNNMAFRNNLQKAREWSQIKSNLQRISNNLRKDKTVSKMNNNKQTLITQRFQRAYQLRRQSIDSQKRITQQRFNMIRTNRSRKDSVRSSQRNSAHRKQRTLQEIKNSFRERNLKELNEMQLKKNQSQLILKHYQIQMLDISMKLKKVTERLKRTK